MSPHEQISERATKAEMNERLLQIEVASELKIKFAGRTKLEPGEVEKEFDLLMKAKRKHEKT